LSGRELRYPADVSLAYGLQNSEPVGMQDYLKRVGRNLKSARLKAGLRQIDVNEKVGITYRHYQNIEAGRINVTVGTLCRLAKLYKATVSELVEGC
jgi:DNA-binding XRE family transcriptional regulator